MTDVVPFDFNGNKVRVVMIDNEPWWVVNDVCTVLGIVQTRNAVDRLDREDVRQTAILSPQGTRQQTNIVNEPGLYELIFRSDKPGARAFRKWVTKEVLPQIRKTGNYIGSAINLYVLDAPTQWAKMFEDWTKEEARRLKIPYPIFVTEYVYAYLPDGVLDELRRRNPYKSYGYRRYRHHQLLTKERGKLELRELLLGFKTICRASNDREVLDMLMQVVARDRAIES